jgi:hypothetical protein
VGCVAHNHAAQATYSDCEATYSGAQSCSTGNHAAQATYSDFVGCLEGQCCLSRV